MGRALWTLGGLGGIPFAPGTCGTLGALALVLLAVAFAPAAALPYAIAGAALLAAAGCVLLGPAAERALARHDPSEFVLDEAAGFWLALVALPLQEYRGAVLAGTFLAFRLFDILKPWPLGRLQRLPGGWGILLDDLGAGLYAHLAVRLGLALL
ncbi:MAG: phosphatidylglycerophosphatase A family protein [Planctomycetaceae bacterium]